MSYSISRAPNRLSVVVPRRFSLFFCLFFPLWVGGWVTLAVFNPAGKPDSLLGLLMFGLLTVVFAYRWLWNLGGREELEFTPLTPLVVSYSASPAPEHLRWAELPTLILWGLGAEECQGVRPVALDFPTMDGRSNCATT